VLKGRRDWLSITPEPERVLPRAIATLRAGCEPSSQAIERERARAERIVLHGSRRRWLAWLREAESLAGREHGETARAEELDVARRDVLAVVNNHNALMLGLPSRSATVAAAAQEEEPSR
jgi:hypothetical protein